jgi:hypothetical protein
MGVDRLVLGHDLIRVQGKSRQLQLSGPLLGEVHEGAAEAGALCGRVNRDVLDEQATPEEMSEIRPATGAPATQTVPPSTAEESRSMGAGGLSIRVRYML